MRPDLIYLTPTITFPWSSKKVEQEYPQVFKIKKHHLNTSKINYECSVDDLYKRNYQPKINEYSEFEYSRFLNLEYGMCYYSQGLDHLEAQNFSAAIDGFEKAVSISPFFPQGGKALLFIRSS